MANETFTNLLEQLDALEAAVLSGDSGRLELQSAAIYKALLALGPAESLAMPGKHQRLQLRQVPERLKRIRLNASRRALAVDRELAVLLPRAKPETYSTLNPALTVRRPGY